MSSAPAVAIKGEQLSKLYKVYNKPMDLLKEIFTRREYHRPVWALRDVSFEINKGEVVGIIG
ncbi:MAG TPA: hypothetical protein VGK58_21725, partial [Lacipirellulaceae bacterium]